MLLETDPAEGGSAALEEEAGVVPDDHPLQMRRHADYKTDNKEMRRHADYKTDRQ